jgi:hypothetical protein
MLRNNLSTRPFYNERAVHMAIAVAAILVLGLTAINVFRMVTLSKQNTELSSRINRDNAEAEQLSRMAADILRRVDKTELQLVADSAREANSLIDQRTFSWTAFFNRIESTLPPDVMLSAVRPSVRDGVTRVNMTVLARRAEDIDEFMEKLEATGAFDEVVPAQQDVTDSRLFRASIDSIYTGAAVDDAAAAEPAPAAAPAATAPAPGTPPPAADPKKPGGGQ